MKINLVHDWLVDFGGAEKVLETLTEVFNPQKIYTLFYDEKNFKNSPISKREIITSFLDKGFVKKRYRNFLPFFPYAVEQFDIEESDILISSSHCVAKGAMPKVNQLHICYCHTPLRYAWDQSYDYLKLLKLDKGIKGLLVKWALHYMRVWDESSSKRVDYFISNSNFVGERIKKFYKRESVTIYPPCDVEPPKEEIKKDESFVFASRLVHYKRADLVVDVFNELKIPLKIIGDGPQYKELKETAESNIKFLGRLERDELRKEIASSRALVFPPVEDFGILPVESQSLLTPVIALKKGGSLETVVPPQEGDYSRATGIFFDQQEKESLIKAVKKFIEAENKFQKEALIKNSQRFSKERFVREISQFVRQKYEEKNSLC
ncbi:MAG: glycosyltransferase [Acidobacteria bacterium]|nr:glycosyltransferase [Acidobacteriota bacterium]